MNKKVLLSFLSLVLVFGLTACGTKDENEEVTSVEEIQNLSKKDVSEVISGSFNDLLKSGKTLKCTFYSDEEGAKMSGVSYISKNKVRNDTTVTMDGKEFKSYMITDEDYTYFWNGESGKGTKMNTDETENDFEENDSFTDEGFEDEVDEMTDMDLEYEFDCQPWKVDNKLFTLPSDIEFEDYGAKMEEMKKQIREDNERFKKGEPAAAIEPTEEMCNICDMAPDPAGCKATLNCK